MLHVHSLMLPPLVKVKGNGLLRLVPPLKNDNGDTLIYWYPMGYMVVSWHFV